MVLFLCVLTLYRYEICFVDSVRLALQYKTAKLHVHSLMRSTKLNKICIILQFVVDRHLKPQCLHKVWLPGHL